MDGTRLIARKQKKKGIGIPFSFYYSARNKLCSLFCLLVLNLIVVNFIDLFRLDQSFSAPGIESDISESFLFFLIFIGVIVPVIEEFVFRFWIGKSILNLIPSSIVLMLYLILVDYNFGFNIVFVLIFLSHAIYAIFNKEKQVRVVVLSGFVFALFHSVNYSPSELVSGAYLLPILFFPQLLLGSIVAYLRAFGFIYSVLYHIMYNSILILYEYLSN